MGCESPKKSNNGVVVTGYDSPSSQVNLVDNIELIELEFTHKSMLTNIRKIDFVDSLIILQDEACGILCFDRNGKFLNSISGKGRASNEYIRLNTYAIDGDQVLIFDSYSNKIMRFYLNGMFIDSQRCAPGVLGEIHRVELLNDGRILQNNLLLGQDNNIYTILNTQNEKQNLLSTPMHSYSAGHFIGANPMTQNTDGVLMVRPFDNVIYRLSKFNNLEPAYTIATTKKLAGDNVLSEQKEFSIMTYMELSDYFWGFTSIFDTDKYLVLSFFDNDYFCLDKLTNQIALLDNNITEDSTILPLINILYSTPNQLIGVASPIKLHDYIEGNHLLSGSLTSTIEDMSLDINPVLVIYNLK